MWLAALRIEGNAQSTPLAWSAVWPDVPDPARNTLYDVAEVPGSGGTNVWAVGGRGTMLHWNGHTWKKIVVPTTENLRSVVMARPDFGMAVGDNAAIVHWDGTNWSKKTVPAASWFKSVVLTPGGPSDEAWTAGDQASIGLLWKWTGTGWTNRVAGANQQFSGTGWGLSMVAPTWSSVTSPTTKTLYGLHALSPSNIWAVGDNGAILHGDGVTWSNVPSPVSHWLTGISMVSPTNGWIVGNFGTILNWNGSVWTNLTNGPTSVQLNGVAVRQSGNDVMGWAVGADGHLCWLSNGLWRAGASPTMQSLLAVDMISPHEAWAVGDHGVLLHWKDQVGLRLLTNGLIEIDWAGQALETATDVSGTWTTVQENAGPPGAMTPGEPTRFFRAR